MSEQPFSFKRGGSIYVQNILLGILPFIFFAEFLSLLAFVPSATRGHSDFRQLYAAAHMIRAGHGHELYEYSAQKTFQDSFVSREEYVLPFLRPAYEALLFVPFSFFQYRQAYFSFMAVNVVLLVLASRIFRAGRENLRWRWLPLLLFPAFIPVCVALMQGQDSIMLLTLLAAAMTMLRQQRDLGAGVLVAFGLFKFQIVIPIAALFLIWRRWRFCAGFFLFGSVLALISLWITGIPETSAHLRSLLSVGVGAGAAPEQFKVPLRVTMMANLRGVFFGIAASRLSGSTLRILTIASSAVVLFSVGVLLRNKRDKIDIFPVAVTVSVLLSYYLFVHDLSVLLIPIVWTLAIVLSEENTTTLGHLASIAALACFVTPVTLFVAVNYFYLVFLPICLLLIIQVRSAHHEAIGNTRIAAVASRS